jgi:hypothetical protein
VNGAGGQPVRGFLRLLGHSFGLAFWRRPQARVELAGFGLFLAACGLALLAFALQDFSSAQEPVEFFGDGFHAHASYFLLVLVAAWLAAELLQRPALWLSLATLGLLVGVFWTAISLQVELVFADAEMAQLIAWRVLLALAGFLAIFRTVGFLAGATAPLRRLGASLVFVLVLAWPWYWQQSAWFWLATDEPVPDTVEPPPESPPPPGVIRAAANFDAESVLYQQPRMLRHALAALRAQTPGKIDLFTLGFAGDGSARVFRNEVEYFARLMSGRFDASGHTLSLINSPDTVARVPLATLTNLRRALAGVAARMDTREDVLFLFLTSHGSEDHRLFVGMDPLPLRQIQPRDLRASLDDAGIRWRVIVVSACYSGGFVDALRDPDTLVITAARADRSSFGCDSDSKITWFGKAFLAEALNQTTDFEHGFDLATRRIRAWELAQGETPSVPQMAGGWAIRKHLASWRQRVPAAQPVLFLPAQPPRLAPR